LPNSITEIGNSTFGGCSNLSSVGIPPSVQTIAWCAFQRCSSLSNVVLHEGLAKIDAYAFSNTAIATITLPKSAQVDVRAFSNTPYETQTKRRREDKCQHCGGSFKGLFKSVCSNCGKPKDY
jgi:hypothetical protein